MQEWLREWTRRQAPLAAVLLVAVLLGGTIALVSSGASTQALLGAVRGPRNGVPTPAATATPIPTPTPAPVPPLTRPGRLAGAVTITLGGSQVLVGTRDALFNVAGAVATPLPAPKDVQGVAVSAKNPSRVVAGGASIQYSDDGGRTYRATKAAPPGAGPYVTLLVSADDPDVWFFQHGQRLLRTRDAGVSWRELTGLPNLQSPLMEPGAKTDEHVLVDGSTVVVLDDNGQQLSVRTGVPSPARWAGVIGTDVYASAADGHVYKSTGTGWSQTAAGLAGPMAGAGGAVWVGDGGQAIGVAAALARSTDGLTWASADGLPADEPVVALATDRTGTTVAVYCLGGDVYRSTDGGRTFTLFSTALRG